MLTSRLIHALSLSLGLPADFLDSISNTPLATLRLHHYTSEKSDEEAGVYGAGALQWNTSHFCFRSDDATRSGRLLMKLAGHPSAFAGAHTDWGICTILATDSVPGLQILHNGSWLDVPPKPDCFVVNLGDLMQRCVSTIFTVCPLLGS